MRLVSPRSASALLAIALLGCPVEPPANDDDDAIDDDDSSPDDDDDDTGLLPTWPSLQPMLSFRCACHRTAEGGDGGLIGIEDLALGHANLVDEPSDDVPGMDRIEPGDPERSYLLLKVLDTHRSVGGAGRRMPPTGVALREDQVDAIRTWILDGALAE